MNYQLTEKDDEISRLTVEISSINTRNRDMADNRFREEIEDRERQINKLNTDFMSLKSTLSILEDDKTYHEENYRRATNELYTLRSQLNQAQEDNNALSEQLYLKSQEVNKLNITVQNAEILSE